MTVTEEQVGQRIDNFLFSALKGVPKSRIYKGLRKGEFRVNSARVSADYRLCCNDRLRIPPLRVAESKSMSPVAPRLLALIESRISYEDESLLVVNKPAGIPVHGGSQISWGLIELLRKLRPQSKSLELIHRLDRETSGCLLIAKRRAALLEWHKLLMDRQVKKRYILLVKGEWDPKTKIVSLPLKKNVLQSGERIVTVDPSGKPAETHFRILKKFKDSTLLSASLITGRTHQLRVHAAASGHPIAGDDKYGDKRFNGKVRTEGLKRLFLHCDSMERRHKTDKGFQGITIPLDEELECFLKLKSEADGNR